MQMIVECFLTVPHLGFLVSHFLWNLSPNDIWHHHCNIYFWKCLFFSFSSRWMFFYSIIFGYSLLYSILSGLQNNLVWHYCRLAKTHNDKAGDVCSLASAQRRFLCTYSAVAKFCNCGLYTLALTIADTLKVLLLVYRYTCDPGCTFLTLFVLV